MPGGGVCDRLRVNLRQTRSGIFHQSLPGAVNIASGVYRRLELRVKRQTVTAPVCAAAGTSVPPAAGTGPCRGGGASACSHVGHRVTDLALTPLTPLTALTALAALMWC